ncbi:glycosyltransferase family 2 protein [Butyrivibrio sp. NC2007]|uniref:glycosyltransferase family 2 protein n=1 Tax=Butyrivibrio sp. NC2007 TaxID=1280683 RepID=UPI0003B37349|nr:glycosyltransferase [Butyrivibrio sp. NC2007]
MNNLISILLPVYNEPFEWVRIAVESILNQTYNRIEIILIVDNPERNDICEWINGLGEDRIVLVRNEKNIGLVDSLNKGLGFCHGDYIARMDSDDISLPHRLQWQLSYLQEHECDIVGGNTVTFNDRDGELYHSNCPDSIEGMHKFISFGGSIPHPTWLVKKGVYQSLDGYRHIEFAEDYDFLVRAVIAGYRVGCVKEICLRYRQNIEGISQKNKGRQKYVARLIRDQLRNNKEYSLQYINETITGNKNRIAMYTAYYEFTRNVRLALKKRDISRIVKLLKKIRISFAGVLIVDLYDDLRRK